MRIAFLVNDLHLSGGINVVVKHASGLSQNHGHDVAIVVALDRKIQEWHFPELRNVNVIPLKDASAEKFDVVIATWWETVFNIGLLNADRAVWFMQSMEDRFYASGDPIQVLAQSALAIDIPILTEAVWIKRQMELIDPSRLIGYAPNGIDKSVFKHRDVGVEQSSEAPLRVLIEGSQYAPNKGVAQSFEVVDAMANSVEVTWVTSSGARGEDRPNTRIVGPLTFEEMSEEYSRADVLLKLSRVEGMFGPPLEAFHCGATAVVAPVTGAEEYILSGFNAEVVPWDDVIGTARVLDLLARDRERLHRLQQGALTTAAKWPDWTESTAHFERELQQIVADPRCPDLSRVRAQASIIRLGRIQARINHMNSIDTLNVAVNSIEMVQSLEKTVTSLRDEIESLAEAHKEREWWLTFSDRTTVRILLAFRRRYRRIRYRLRRNAPRGL